jgi:hypothetical protein
MTLWHTLLTNLVVKVKLLVRTPREKDPSKRGRLMGNNPIDVTKISAAEASFRKQIASYIGDLLKGA